MEKIRFGAMCEKLFLQPLVGDTDDVLYFSESQLVSAGLTLSGVKAGLALLSKGENDNGIKSADCGESAAKSGLRDCNFKVDALKGRAVILGKEEVAFLLSFDDDEMAKRLKLIMSAELIILTDRALESIVTKVAKDNKKNVAISLKPASVYTNLPLYIEGKLNTVEIIHGQLMDVFGVGVLIIGESGVGKSEIALDLVTRGHLLVADDAVAVRREGNTLIGCSPSITRHLMELRGIGIIDVRAMFGAGAVKVEQEIDIAINLEMYSELKDYEELHHYTLSGVSIPLIDLPLRQGRNISVLIEVAARNLRLRAMGHDAGDELNRRIEKSNSEKNGSIKNE